MRQAPLVMVAIVTLGVLASQPARDAAAQELALADRRPRFLYTPSAETAPVEIDASRHAVLRSVVGLHVEQPTIGRLLAAIERQTGLRFAHDGTFPIHRPITLRADSITVAAALSAMLLDTGVDVVLSRGVRVALVKVPAGSARQQAGVVVGTVTDGKSGDGLGGVDVALEGTRWRVTTDVDGRYRLADVAPRSYSVLVRRIGYAPERRATTVAAGQEVTVDITLQPTATKLGDVIVTAQKREERLQDVPLSIAVVTPEAIDRRGLVSEEDYLRGIPGVNQVAQRGGAGTIVIRGLESNLGFQNYGSGATVATYFGETPTTNSSGLAGNAQIDLKLVDIERVEVLRGPQGTAFGNASLSGAVRTIPAAPKLDRIEGKVEAGYSQTSGTGSDNNHVQATVNLPLVKDKLALRATGYRYDESGIYRNVAGSDPVFQAAAAGWGVPQALVTDVDDVGASRFIGGRMAALFQASDALKVTLSYLTQKTEQDGAGMATTGTYAQKFSQIAPTHAVRGQTGVVWDTDIDLANATLEYDLGWANVLATYSYMDSRSVSTHDGNVVIPPAFPWSLLYGGDHREHSGEIRMTTRFDGAWNFVGGVYAERLKDDYEDNSYWYGSPEMRPGWLGAGLGNEVRAHTFLDLRDLTQKAAFAEVAWEFLPDFTFTGGARVYDYDRTGQIVRGGPLYGVAPGAVAEVTDIGAEASGTSFRGNLSHKLTDNALVYGAWAQGFRLGTPLPGLPVGVCDTDSDGIVDGTNVSIDGTRELKSDEVDSYELGGKFTLLDRRLMIAADVYRMDWFGLPVVSFAPCNFGYRTNAGAARSEGVELEASVFVTEAFRVDAGGSWNRAKLTKDVPAQGWVAGDRLPGSPKFKANLGLQYEFKLGGSATFLRTDGIYIGPFFGSMAEPVGSIPAGDYVKVDVSARVALPQLDVGLFVRNLTNDDAFTYRGAGNPSDADVFTGFRLRPRTIGLQVSRNF